MLKPGHNTREIATGAFCLLIGVAFNIAVIILKFIFVVRPPKPGVDNFDDVFKFKVNK